jgi:hypothetical protein
MLSDATVRTISSTHKFGIDIGKLLDTALYYKRVHLLIDDYGASAIVKDIGANGLIRILDTPTISATIVGDAYGIRVMKIKYRDVFFPGGYRVDNVKNPDPNDIAGGLFRQLKMHNMDDISPKEVDGIVERSGHQSPYEVIGSREYDSNEIWISISKNPDAIRDAVIVAAADFGLLINNEALKSARFVAFQQENGVSLWSDVDIDVLAPPA